MLDHETSRVDGNVNSADQHTDDEPQKAGVILFADAGAHPDAVMVEFGDTVIAIVAVGSIAWPEDLTRLTELEPGRGDSIVDPVKESFLLIDHARVLAVDPLAGF